MPGKILVYPPENDMRGKFDALLKVSNDSYSAAGDWLTKGTGVRFLAAAQVPRGEGLVQVPRTARSVISSLWVSRHQITEDAAAR